MATNIHTQLIGAVILLSSVVPDDVILTALAGPNRQLHCLHTFGRADICHHHIKTLGSLVFNVNRASHTIFGFFHLRRGTRYTLQAAI